ncbi:hypothetical protein EDB89DRAFT_2241537 [Lactarius sanguifluus]|nr:hypothetical protein EDB89DRAFT_2241537 [Lactarius sanguifluus]
MPTTPPNSNHHPPGSTPSNTPLRKEGLVTLQKYGLRRMREICEKFVGPMPVESFLTEFVPEAPNTRPTTAIAFAHKTVSQNENEFASIATLPSIPVLTGTIRGLTPGVSRSLNWTAVDLWIENKNEKDDVFRDLEEMGREARAKSDLKSHIRWTKSAYRVSGQLIAYTSAIHRSQFRVFSFSVVLFAASYTPSRSTGPPNPTHSSNSYGGSTSFLTVKRGYDTTVTSVGDDEAEAALSKLRTYEGLENVAKADLHKFLVRDDHTLNGQIKYFIAPSAVWDSEALFGRSTFGYVAYDPETTNLVYLKDFWRTDRDGIQKEGDVYRELHDAQVPNIARLGLAGDVPLLPECGRTDCPAVQRTMTQEFVKGYDWCPGQPRVDPYVHYRLVLETLGSPLNTFKSTRELCKVIRDAIIAHMAAYERAGILHRDVSAGNILITEDGSGILIDWDLSKKVVKGGSGTQRQHSRTGTWQFISIALLQKPSIRPHEVSDDLESFFWVLLYLVAKCRGPRNVSKQMQIVFDQSDDMDDDGIIGGGTGKLNCLRQAAQALGPRIVHGFVQTPCKDIIEELRSLFNNLYLYVEPPADITPSMELDIKSDREKDERVQDAVKKLQSSEEVLSIINEHLKSRWDDNDGSHYKDRFRPSPDPATSRNRRKRKAEDDDGKDFNERRRGRFPPSSTQPSHSRDILRLQRHRSSFGSGSSRTRPSENP